MKGKTRNALLLGCLTALLSTAGVASVNAVNANATTDVTPTSFALENAASIRTATPYGIRFMANISADDYNKLTKTQGSSVEFGMLICPSDYITADNPLDMDETTGTMTEYIDGAGVVTNTYQKKKVESLAEVRDKENNLVGYNYSGSLTGIHENNLSRPFTAVGYIEYKASAEATPVVYYTAPVSRAIYTVATYAAVDTTKTYDTNVLSFLNDVITDVQTVYNQTEVSIVSDGADFAYKMLAVDDEFTLSATVSNGENTLETNPALVENELVKKVEDKKNTYKVTGLGELDLTVKVGENSEKPLTNTTLNVTDDFYYSGVKNIAMEELVPGYSGADFTVEKETEAVGGVSNTIKIQNDKNLSRVGIPASIANMIEEGDYLVFDAYSEAGPYFGFETVVGNAGLQYISSNATGEIANVYKWRTLTTDETAWDKAPLSTSAKWVRVEMQFLQDVEINEEEKFYIFLEGTTWHPFPVYLNNIRVQTYPCGYASSEVVGYDEEKTYAVGEEVAIQANVIDYVGRSKAVTPTITVASGTATLTADSKVKMAFGDSTLSVDTGVGDSLSVTLKGSTTMNVFNSKETQSNILYTDNTGMSNPSVVGATKDVNNVGSDVTYKESYMGMNNVLELHAYSKDYGALLQFAGTAGEMAQRETYVYMDIFVPDNGAYVHASGDVAYEIATSNSRDDSTGWFQLYDGNGTAWTGTTLWNGKDFRNQWIHLGFKVTRPLAVGNGYAYVGVAPNAYAGNAGEQYLYVANIVLSSEKMTTITPKTLTMDLTEAMSPASANVSLVSAGTITANGVSRENAYSWTMAENESKLAFNESPRKMFTATRGCYVTFDIYVQQNISLAVNVAGTDCYEMYYSGPSGEKEGVMKYQFYDADGNPYTSGDFWNSAFIGKWVTVEIQWLKDMTAGASNYHDVLYLYSSGHATAEKPIYLANMTISNVSRMAK